MKKKNEIGILASGGLGLSTLISLSEYLFPAFILTDSGSTKIIKYAKDHFIPVFVGNPRKGKTKEFLKDKNIDVLFSINYLYLVESDILEKAKLYSINFHGSLLPKYRGRTPHVWAIINGENKSGITAHLMTSECDAGDIVLQVEVDILLDDTGADILNKYSALYPAMIKQILDNIVNDDLCLKSQEEHCATYFSKRTPEDGKIDLDWHSTRIRNWVRAQSSPYPGAFCFYKNKKVIIDSICVSDMGFKDSIPNGTILAVYPELLVKVSDKVIEFSSVRCLSDFNFTVGDKFE